MRAPLSPEEEIELSRSSLIKVYCTDPDGCISTVMVVPHMEDRALCGPHLQAKAHGNVAAPPVKVNTCLVCGETGRTVHLYRDGYRCPHHPSPRANDNFWGLHSIPNGWTDPRRPGQADRIRRAATYTGWSFTDPPLDSETRAACIYCVRWFPLHHPADAALALNGHEALHHLPWLLGGRGGITYRLDQNGQARANVCDPCQGISPGGFTEDNIQLPPKGQPFGLTFQSRRCSLCQNGQRRGRYTIICNCRHRPNPLVKSKETTTDDDTRQPARRRGRDTQTGPDLLA